MQRCPPSHQQEGKKGIQSKRRTALHQTNSDFKTLSHITVHKTEGLREVATELTATRSATDAKKQKHKASLRKQNRKRHIGKSEQKYSSYVSFHCDCYCRLDKAFSGFHLVMSVIIITYWSQMSPSALKRDFVLHGFENQLIRVWCQNFKSISVFWARAEDRAYFLN